MGVAAGSHDWSAISYPRVRVRCVRAGCFGAHQAGVRGCRCWWRVGVGYARAGHGPLQDIRALPGPHGCAADERVTVIASIGKPQSPTCARVYAECPASVRLHGACEATTLRS